ncbi:hypothetical protein NQZ68_009039 [Dissostichus eleginoides]|nr:hypothetical protein NQZ68_009039 [Dissostichus eleginoides]
MGTGPPVLFMAMLLRKRRHVCLDFLPGPWYEYAIGAREKPVTTWDPPDWAFHQMIRHVIAVPDTFLRHVWKFIR